MPTIQMHYRNEPFFDADEDDPNAVIDVNDDLIQMRERVQDYMASTNHDGVLDTLLIIANVARMRSLIYAPTSRPISAWYELLALYITNMLDMMTSLGGVDLPKPNRELENQFLYVPEITNGMQIH